MNRLITLPFAVVCGTVLLSADTTDILTAISTVGFPIVMCLLMWFMNDKQDVRHAEETTKMTEALNNNTIVMQKLVDRLE